MSSSSSLPPQQAFDNLADLFLTEPLDADELAAIEFGDHPATAELRDADHSPASIEDDDHRSGKRAERERSNGPFAPSLNLVGADDGEVDDDHDQRDTSQESFCAEREAAALPDRTSARQEITLLLTSHLPVQGRLWINQIASVLSRRSGPTILLRRAQPGDASVDVFTSPAHSDMHHAIRDTLADAGRPGTSIDGVVPTLQKFVSRWMIHLDDVDARAIQRRVAQTRSNIRIVIATGVDPAAMVGVYRTLKMLLPALDETIRVGLIFVGSDEAQTRSAFDRLERAVGGFLDRRIEYLGTIRRMEPIEFSNLGEFAIGAKQKSTEPGALLDLIQVIAGGIQDEAEQRDREPQRVQAEIHVRTIDDPSRHDRAEQRRRASADRASSTSEVKPTVSANHGEPRLVEFVPGLIDLVARSPKAPAIELACDNDGRIHLLARDVDDDPRHASAESIEHLLNACDWIEAHASILALLRTMPSHVSERIRDNMGRIETVAHLFTATPKRYARLMDGRLRIHLLATEADLHRHADTGWCHLPIN